MLDFTDAEKAALAIIVLKTTLKEERYGAAHQRNWKKVGLSRASFKDKLVCESAMPSIKAKAAFNFLKDHNKFYKYFLVRQSECLQTGAALSISSYDLFIIEKGIECAMFPHLYPTADFTDTGVLQTTLA
jgi:hypothetical protein